MLKALLAACVCCCLVGAAQADTSLTDTETHWLELGWPAVVYAREQGMPLDIVVQPQSTPGLAPLAMAYVDGRCKLVLSMRGNPDAETALAQVPPDLLTPVIEAMAAHELGHCWRYVRGAWHTVPAGFAAAPAAAPSSDPQLAAMQQTRREEGFADLVGLAWTAQRHPQRYAEVHAWLMKFRDDPAHPGSHHDTVVWLQLASDASVFGASSSLFDQAWPLWQEGLRSRP
jgi:hypothetical protein